MKKILSLDCAHRTLGYTVADINDNFAADISAADIDTVAKILHSFIIIRDIGVIDVIGGRLKDIPRQDRIRAMISTLEKFPPVDLVLVEEQPGMIMQKRVSSESAQDIICTFYIMRGIPVKLIPPAMKNRINLCNVVRGELSKYEYNKRRSVENFRAFCTAFGYMDVFGRLKKSTIDDAADSFMQVWVYSFELII